MRLSEAKAKKVTLSQYFISEERAEVKHEFHNGKLIPMPGGTFYHNKIINNIIFCPEPRAGRQRGHFSYFRK